jgi:hypothetical protein
VRVSAAALCVAAVLATGRPAAAIPYFASEYQVKCQKCHTVIPRLNEFGREFMDHGYAMPGATPLKVFPISGKVNLVYSSNPDPGFPKAMVDEVELYLAGKPSPRTNYFVEQYIVDGGAPGNLREAWFQDRLTADGAKIPAYAQGGAFTLPLPVDPESFRETYADYAIYVQTVGNNPFNFFDSKVGAQVRAGSSERGLSVHVAALQGHDTQSGLPSDGVDFMGYAQDAIGPWTISAYAYTGQRPDGGLADRFRREGLGLTYGSNRWSSETVWQTGHDDSFLGAPVGVNSSGGFTQLRYEATNRLFFLARYDATNTPGTGFYQDVIPLVGYRLTRYSRLTAEDVFSASPRQTLNVQLTVGI